MAVTHTEKYRIVSDRPTRSLSIKRAGTWAAVSTLVVPDDEPGLMAAVIQAIGDLAERQEAVKPEPKTDTPDQVPDTPPKKPRTKKTPTA